MNKLKYELRMLKNFKVTDSITSEFIFIILFIIHAVFDLIKGFSIRKIIYLLHIYKYLFRYNQTIYFLKTYYQLTFFIFTFFYAKLLQYLRFNHRPKTCYRDQKPENRIKLALPQVI